MNTLRAIGPSYRRLSTVCIDPVLAPVAPQGKAFNPDVGSQARGIGRLVLIEDFDKVYRRRRRVGRDINQWNEFRRGGSGEED